MRRDGLRSRVPEEPLLFHPVVGRFLRNLDVVDVALASASGGDPNELGLSLQLRDRGAAAITHAGAKTAYQLVDHGGDAAFMGHAALDAFGNQLVGRAAAFEIELVLEVLIAAATAHRANRAHAAVLL